ncbi:hypothetical protein HGM15179_014058 [Zosterops borbonicus]|uniref:Uncharacterized protein n=1 Tax=Zosterops borbonicus TaxID=364589 RepID=A0A8K1G7H5_9PASS|nr:hypothetical protein HGM15179_014058 [Zosterops borbonicus]
MEDFIEPLASYCECKAKKYFFRDRKSTLLQHSLGVKVLLIWVLAQALTLHGMLEMGITIPGIPAHTILNEARLHIPAHPHHPTLDAPPPPEVPPDLSGSKVVQKTLRIIFGESKDALDLYFP